MGYSGYNIGMASRRVGETDEQFRERKRVAQAERRARRRAEKGLAPSPPAPPRPQPTTSTAVAELVEAPVPTPTNPAEAIQSHVIETLAATTDVARRTARHANGHRDEPCPTDDELARAMAASKLADPVVKPMVDRVLAKQMIENGTLALPQGPPRSVEETMGRLGMAGPSWGVWRTVARLVDGTELDAADMINLKERCGLDSPPPGRVHTLYAVCGRRAGKSSWTAAAAVTWACRRYSQITDPTVGVVARTREQARVVHGYCREFAERLGVLDGEPTATMVPIRGGVVIRVLPNTPSVRGPNYVAAILDEAAHLAASVRGAADGSAWSDKDLLTALTPGLATTRNPLLAIISTPGPRRGIIAEAKAEWDEGKRKPGVLLLHGPTRSLNPTISEETIADLIMANPLLESEFSASFFADAGAWLPAHVLSDEVVAGLPERREPGGGDLFAFCDLASGGGRDGAGLAVAERLPDGRAALIDAWHWTPPFTPEAAIAEGAAALKALSINAVSGDLVSKGFQAEAWARHGIAYRENSTSASDLYAAVLGPVLAGRVDWINHPVMIAEFRGLVESARATGKPRVTHPGGQHDDLANSAAGALVLALSQRRRKLLVG